MFIAATGGMVDKTQFIPNAEKWQEELLINEELDLKNIPIYKESQSIKESENEKLISATSASSLINNSLKKSPVQMKDKHADKTKKAPVYWCICIDICMYLYI